MAQKMAVLSSGSALTRTQRRIFYAEYSSSGETSNTPRVSGGTGGSSGPLGGGASFGGGGQTYPHFKLVLGFRPLYFEIAEFWHLFFILC